MRSYDLIVLGAGSGNMLFNSNLERLRTAIVEPARFGGTCLNTGCIPSKMFVVAADAARSVKDASRLGVHASLDHVDWPGIRDRIFGRIDPLHQQAVDYRRAEGVDVFTSEARFVAPRELLVGDEHLRAERIVVAVGSRPTVPPIPGLTDIAFHTSDTIMRIASLPTSLAIIGGGFIAAELGHVFASFGTDVTIVQRGPRLLMAEDEEISQAFTDDFAKRVRVLLNTEVTSAESTPNGVRVHVTTDGKASTVVTETLLVATGRQPNTDVLDARAGGLELDEHGHIVHDDAFRTSIDGVWAFGDAANHFQLKHMANAEMRVVRHNIMHPVSTRSLTRSTTPHAVFSDPQIAAVGLTETQARDQGIDFLQATVPYSDAAYGWALEDTTSFVKLLADRSSQRLIGAHIIGTQASTLLQPLVQAIMLGNTIEEISRGVIYIHPALTEVVEQCLLALQPSN